MPNRRRILLVLLLLAARQLCGQSFQKEYAPAGGGSVIPYNAALRPDGKFLVSHMVNDDSVRLHVTCLESDGAVGWSVRLRAHTNITGSEGFVEGPIAATSDNGCIVMVSKSYQSQVVQQGWALVKLGPDGMVQWNRQIAGVGLLDDFLERSGGRTFVAARYPPSPYKRYLACLADNGTVLWEKDLSSDLGTVAISGTQALAGQRILLLLHTENANLSAGHLAVLDDAGNFTNVLSLGGFTFMHALEHPDGRLFFLGNTAEKILLGQIQNGQLQWTKVPCLPADAYFYGALAFNGAHDSLMVSFQSAALEEQRLLMQFDLNGNFSRGHFLPSKEAAFNKLLALPGGGWAWTSFSTNNPLRAFVFVKTDADGRLDACPAGQLCQVNMRDTLLQPLPPPSWTTENVTHIVARPATSVFQTLTSTDYCAPLPSFNADILISDTSGCTGDAFVFHRDSLTTGASKWLLEGGVPDRFYGPEPPGVIFPDTGNFTVLHILEQAGCRDTTQVNIRIGEKPALVLPSDTLVCPDSSILINPGNGPGWQYHWNDGVTLASRWAKAPGNFSVTVTNAVGCSDAGAVQVKTVDFPREPLPADTFSCENTPLYLEIPTPQDWQFVWADGFPATGRFIYTAGMYTLLATSPEGCMLADSMQVALTPCPECFVYLPNVIRPDSGGENGAFGIYTNCLALEYSLRIFDRWGNLVFESKDPVQFWDGTSRGRTVAPGVYVFQIRGVLSNGNTVSDFSRSGSVSVVR
ncbi:MAG: gliding motility-associated C-terminal domain-containing protein [Haliscomenobacteraceae bacterium CHB4]|nr:gliding motility-associated C-terminal domain-containing protein [Haliscomenobacteraceae bacterium CHB4]